MRIREFQKGADVVYGHVRPDGDPGDRPSQEMGVLTVKSEMRVGEVHVWIANESVFALLLPTECLG